MRIAIDARLNAYRQGGIPQYTRQLVTALADVATDDQIVSLQHRDQLRPLAIAPNVVRRTAFTPPHHRFEQWTLPLEVLLARPDVLHCPDFIAPTRRSSPAVVTIHDLAFMHYPEILDVSARAYYSQVTTNAPRADAIIAVSESTRQDIAQFLDIPIEQIDVIYEAAAPLYTKINLREGEARVLNSTPVAADTFMLFVSTLEPRKNLPTLLQALRICIDRRPEARYRLVIVGRRGWRDEAIFQTARDLKLADHVLFTGNVGQYDLRWLYNACRLYINPSLYEGFGLPLLEAMACGAACLAAATSSLPEIGGDAAIYVPPLEAEQWADEIMALWDDEDRRAELGRMGVARAQQFSWNRAARETLKVYRRAIDRIVLRAEPYPAQRATQPPEPLHAHSLIALAADAPRPCLRCGTALLPGDLQLGMSRRFADAGPAGSTMAPRIWSCPRCGYVELVDETFLAAHHEQPHALEEAPATIEIAEWADQAADNATLVDEPITLEQAQMPTEIVEQEDDSVDNAAALDEPVALETEEWLDEPVALEEDSATTVIAEQADEAADTLLDESAALDDLPLDDPVALEAGAATELDEQEVAPADQLVTQSIDELVALEAAPLDSPATLEQALSAEPVAQADQPVDEPDAQEADTVIVEAQEDQPVDEPDAQEADTVIVEAQEDQPVDEPVAPEEEPVELEEKAVASANVAESAQTELADPVTPASSAGQAAHAAGTSNGAVPKPKSGQRSRRPPPAAEPNGKQPPKRRSSGSKRKQTS